MLIKQTAAIYGTERGGGRKEGGREGGRKGERKEGGGAQMPRATTFALFYVLCDAMGLPVLAENCGCV